MTPEMLESLKKRCTGKAAKAQDVLGTLYEYERTIANLIHEVQWLQNRVRGLEKQAELRNGSNTSA